MFFGCVLVALACAACGDDAPIFVALSDHEVAVGQEVRILVLASDPDGDRVQYAYRTDIEGSKQRVFFEQGEAGAAEFRWFPSATDIGVWSVDFTASDGISTAQQTVRIQVRGSIGPDAAPRFVRPQGVGTSLDRDLDREIALQVEVLDLDSPRVKIRQHPEVPGSFFKESIGSGGKQGVWHWRPTDAQLRQEHPQIVEFWAEDGEHPAAHFSYVVILTGGRR